MKTLLYHYFMIRPAKLSDLPQIVSIYNQTIPLKNVTADTVPVSVESRTEWFSQFNEQRPIWVYENEDGVVAWTSLRSFYGRPAYHATVEIGIYIASSYRNKGIGELMLLHAHRFCKENKIETILAFIFANNGSSVYFFKKHGYIEYGNLPAVAEIDQQKIDLLILGYKL